MAGILEQLKTISEVQDILAFNEHEFKALIGLSPLAFVKLLEPFEQSQTAGKAQIDLGYLGFAADYQTCELHLPIKKPRKFKANPAPTLSDAQKAHNRAVAQIRIVIEHVLASVKHWRILTSKFRNYLSHLEDNVIWAVAGLHNFLLSLST